MNLKSIVTITTICLLTIGLNAQTPVKPQMVFVDGSSFIMGSNIGILEKPSHRVTLSSFSIGKYEVTVAEYKDFCAATGRSMPLIAPSWGWNDKHPMVYISHNDATAYCNWLSEQFNTNYRLPTEAEWEYAAKGGNKSGGYTYAGGNDMDEVGWFEDNSGGQTYAVGRKRPNELGIYDMSGNAWEWCRDWFDYDYYAISPATNPKGPSTGSRRVLRGGNWSNAAYSCRVVSRDGYSPDSKIDYIGFRLVSPE